MTERKTLLRRVFDSLVEGRTRQAERIISAHLKTHPRHPQLRD